MQKEPTIRKERSREERSKEEVKSKSMVYKIIMVLFAILVLAIIFFVVLGVGIYWYNWQNKFAISFPFPAATVNFHILKYSDYLDDLKTLDFFHNAAVKENPQVTKPDSDQIKKNVLLRMVKDEFLTQKAKSFGMTVNEADIEKEWQNIVSQAGGQDKVDKTLRELYNWDSAQFKNKVLKPFILRTKMEQKIAFNDNINAQAKKKAEEVLALVKKGEESFEELARKYSEDTTSGQGGELGYFGKGEMVQEFEEAVSKLQPGEVSGIVQTQYGYHIIKLVEKIAASEGKEEQFHAKHILLKSKNIDEWVNQELTTEKVFIFVRGFLWKKSCTAVLKAGESCSQ